MVIKIIEMKKFIVLIFFFSCSQQVDQSKHRELIQMETNLTSSVHDLLQIVSRMDSAKQPETYRITSQELKTLQKSLDSVRNALGEMPGIDSSE